MYEIVFYHSRNGKSEIEEYLDELGRKAKTSKTDRLTLPTDKSGGFLGQRPLPTK